MEAIQLANTKIDEIRTEFSRRLLEQSSEFKERLAKRYNETFNCFVRPQYNGAHQDFPGLYRESFGTGVNAQKKTVAVHHLDTPWRPSDLQQRDGRAIRKGNEVAKYFANNKVDVIIYAVQKSLDSYKFNLLFNKQLLSISLRKVGQTHHWWGSYGRKIGNKEQQKIADIQKDLPVLQEILSGSWNKEAELTQLKTDLAAIDRRILLSITPESSGAEEGESVEQGEQESQEQHNTPEKQEVKSGVKFRM
mgnify:CR=1 FL=1